VTRRWNLRAIIERIATVPIIGLTATATEKVHSFKKH
jgi:superfamily II DNA helicase RecQ